MDILKLDNNFEKRNYKESKKNLDENNVIFKNVKNKTKKQNVGLFVDQKNFIIIIIIKYY